MMQQPQMTQRDINAALAQLDAQETALERLQDQMEMGPIMPLQNSPFQMQPMQQRRPLESYLLIGAVVAAGLYLFNKSYKLDIQKKPDNIDRIDEMLNAKTVKSSTKKVKPD
jgi:hypothetical protein